MEWPVGLGLVSDGRGGGWVCGGLSKKVVNLNPALKGGGYQRDQAIGAMAATPHVRVL